MIEIVFVLDRSGSMSGNESDVVGGVNKLLDEQRANNVKATVSMFKFDHSYEEIMKHVSITEKTCKLESKDYVPRGTTSLLDAVGRL